MNGAHGINTADDDGGNGHIAQELTADFLYPA